MQDAWMKLAQERLLDNIKLPKGIILHGSFAIWMCDSLYEGEFEDGELKNYSRNKIPYDGNY